MSVTRDTSHRNCLLVTVGDSHRHRQHFWVLLGVKDEIRGLRWRSSRKGEEGVMTKGRVNGSYDRECENQKGRSKIGKHTHRNSLSYSLSHAEAQIYNTLLLCIRCPRVLYRWGDRRGRWTQGRGRRGRVHTCIHTWFGTCVIPSDVRGLVWVWMRREKWNDFSGAQTPYWPGWAIKHSGLSRLRMYPRVTTQSLLERCRTKEHIRHVGDLGHIPLGYVYIKRFRTREHGLHVGNAGHVPIGYVNVERFCTVEHPPHVGNPGHDANSFVPFHQIRTAK